jgi:hypothetical protein
MLYKDYQIEIWQSAWVNRTIDGLNYFLFKYPGYWGYRDITRNYKYIALISGYNPYRPISCIGGSTPLVALGLAKRTIDLLDSSRIII